MKHRKMKIENGHLNKTVKRNEETKNTKLTEGTENNVDIKASNVNEYREIYKQIVEIQGFKSLNTLGTQPVKESDIAKNEANVEKEIIVCHKCDICSKEYSNTKKLRQHMKGHKEIENKCYDCDYTYASKKKPNETFNQNAFWNNAQV